MKKITALAAPTIIAMLCCIAALPAMAQQSRTPDWKPMISANTASVYVACMPAEEGKTTRILFRHTYPGLTTIALVVRQKANDGSERLRTFTASGLSNRMYSHADNLVSNDLVSNNIESITVRYMAYGVSYRLYINAANGSRELTMDGKPYNYGPQYSLQLQSLPLPYADEQPQPPHQYQPIAHAIRRRLGAAMMPLFAFPALLPALHSCSTGRNLSPSSCIE